VMPSGVVVTRFGPSRSLELVAPHRPPTPIDGFLRQFGSGLHHLALRVEEPLEGLLPRLRGAGWEMSDVQPSSDGRPSMFIHPRSIGGVLVELVEGEPR
jgi:methylmalonyl-CoA/ethylmalonyl-CoA epimerase